VPAKCLDPLAAKRPRTPVGRTLFRSARAAKGSCILALACIGRQIRPYIQRSRGLLAAAWRRRPDRNRCILIRDEVLLIDGSDCVYTQSTVSTPAALQ
jgi:hypothetical protein